MKTSSPRNSALCGQLKPLVRRRDLGDEIVDQGFLGQWRQGHFALMQPRRAGIFDRAVDQHHAFLARIGIDAGVAEGKRRIAMRTNMAQTVEHGLGVDERPVETLCRGRYVRRAAANAEWRDHAGTPATLSVDRSANRGEAPCDSAISPSRRAMI